MKLYLMSKSIHLYKLFYDADFNLNIKVPRSIIRGFGFDALIYMTSESGIVKFAEISENDILEILNLWRCNKEDHALIKQNGRISYFSSETVLSDQFVIQEKIQNFQSIKVSWFKDGTLKFSSKIPPLIEIDSKNTVELIEFLINKQIEPILYKLSRLEVSFLLTPTANYCLGISSYAYFAKSEPRLRKSIISDTKPIRAKAASVKKLATVKTKIDKAIEEITKQKESIRNITYKSWIDKVTKGEKLYPNENLFAKNIVEKAKVKGRSAAKCLKDLKLLSAQLRVSLSEKKFKAQLNEGVRRKLEDVLNKRRLTFIIKRPTLPAQRDLNLNEIAAISARNLLNSSEFELSLMTRTHRLTNK